MSGGMYIHELQALRKKITLNHQKSCNTCEYNCYCDEPSICLNCDNFSNWKESEKICLQEENKQLKRMMKEVLYILSGDKE